MDARQVAHGRPSITYRHPARSPRITHAHDARLKHRGRAHSAAFSDAGAAYWDSADTAPLAQVGDGAADGGAGDAEGIYQVLSESIGWPGRNSLLSIRAAIHPAICRCGGNSAR